MKKLGGKTIIRAHGVSADVYEYAKSHNIELVDLTCPKVSKIHSQVQDFANKDYFIFLFGVKNHPETIGTFSFCGKNSFLIESSSDIETGISALYTSNLKNVLIISQTTFSVSLFEDMKNTIIKKLEPDFNIHIENSICNATSLRQLEAKELSSKSDLMIIIGGKNSSNTKKLYEVSKENCENVLKIETKEDLDKEFIKNFQNIGIIAGASTPSDIIDNVLEFLKSI